MGTRVKKERLLLLQGGRCFYCGAPIDAEEACLDHVIPKSLGGKGTDDNLVVCCRSINLAFSNLPPKQKMEWMQRKPEDFFCYQRPMRVEEKKEQPSISEPDGQGHWWGGMGALTQLPKYQTPAVREYLEQESAYVLGNLSPVSGEMVLEVGCGTGRFISELVSSDLDLTVVGVDYVLSLVESATEKFRLHDWVEFFHSEAARLPFSSEMFGSVFLVFNTLGNIKEPRDARAINEACRVLKPSGKLFVSVFANNTDTIAAQKELYALTKWKVHQFADDRVHLDDGVVSRRFSVEQLRGYFSDKHDFEVKVSQLSPISLILEATKLRSPLQGPGAYSGGFDY
jgi:ubiquinone/menaquinone biosynthesis C-methylase UbiE